MGALVCIPILYNYLSTTGRIRFVAGWIGMFSLSISVSCALLINRGLESNPIVICHNFLNTLVIVVPIVIIATPIIFFAIEYIARRSIFKNFNLGFRILISAIVFVLTISVIAMLFVYDGDIVINGRDGAVYLCQGRVGSSASVIKFQHNSSIHNCVFQKADSICKNENDLFHHLSNLVSVNGTLGAYVCSQIPFTDHNSECMNAAQILFMTREFALVAFVAFILIFFVQTIVCAPFLDKCNCIKSTDSTIEAKTLLNNDNLL